MKTTLEFIERIINEQTRYLRTYTGKVVDIDDSTDSEKKDKLGRVKCIIFELGWYKNEQAVWCSPNDKNNLLCPKKDDFVRIGFMNGDPNRPYYTGIITELEKMLPKSYGDHRDQVIFESTDEKFYIKYNEEDKIIKLEHGDDKYSLSWDVKKLEIKDKESQTITLDTENKKAEVKVKNNVKALLDGQNKKIELDNGSGKLGMDGNAKTIDITGSGYKLNLLGATQEFVKGTVFNTWITSFISALNTALGTKKDESGSPGSFTPPINYLSTSIKGE